MNIQKALEETGKAIQPDIPKGLYYSLNESGVLWLYSKIGRPIEIVKFGDIFTYNYTPYYEVKEIRPEKAGELWERDGEFNHRCTTFETDVGLNVIWWDGDTPNTNRIGKDMIHNKNGWTRLYPPVEEPKYGQSIPTILDEQRKNKEARAALDAAVEGGLITAEELQADLKKILNSTEQPFAMDEMSARAAGKWPLKKNYETIEIDKVEWNSDGEIVYPRGGYMAWKGLIGRPPMKMILLLPKEQHECQD